MVQNKYAGKCAKCGGEVAALSGLRSDRPVDGRWVVEHIECPEILASQTPASVPTSVDFPPTPEQAECLELFKTGESMVIQACAGAGKTSTLRLLAQWADEKGLRGLYVAFNKSIVVDVGDSMPKSVLPSTAHALAYKAIVAGGLYADRMKNSRRMRPSEVARRIGITASYVVDENVTLSVDRQAGIVQSAVDEFCKTADASPSKRHFPYIEGIDQPGPRGARTYVNNRKVAKHLEPALRRFWKDIERPKGDLQFKHQYYLKLWQLSHPTIDTDYILFDECQDANPVMTAVINEQKCQVVYVGDSQQQIYSFTGAIDAMKGLPFQVRYLSQSFRFGQPIADVANGILSQIEGAEINVKGFDKITSVVGPIDGEADAVLTRTNACAMDAILNAKQSGVKAHLVGGGKDVLAFALGVRDLQQKGFTSHQDLVAFSSWEEVQKYVREEEQGAELKLMHDLVEKYGVPTILDALNNMPTEDEATLIISTAHKSKGRQWKRVRIAQDFIKQNKDGKQQEPTDEELRLRYVAVTRAQEALDASVLLGEGSQN